MQDLAGDRFLLGLGASKIFMKEIGEGEGEKVGPATVMRESIEIVKGVLAGNAFEYQGKVFQASVPPLKSDAHTPRGIPPIYVAGTGPVLQKNVRRPSATDCSRPASLLLRLCATRARTWKRARAKSEKIRRSSCSVR